MVNRFVLTIGALLVCAPALAITADELRALSNERERADIQRQGRAQSNALGTLLTPAKKSKKYSAESSPDGRAPAEAAPAAAAFTPPIEAGGVAPIPVVPAIRVDGQPVTPNPRATVPAHGAGGGGGGGGGVRAAERGGVNSYIPPARSPDSPSASDAPTTSDAVAPSVAFGIRLGSWLVAALQRNTTSGESGAVELVLIEAYVGDRRTLPAGSMLFADKALNFATRRMELTVKRGITPQGQEFDMEGTVFDPQKTPGLAGVFVLDKKQIASAGLVKGAFTAIGAAATGFGTTAVGQAARSATQSMSSDAQEASDFNNGAKAIIYVSPQKMLIRVERKF